MTLSQKYLKLQGKIQKSHRHVPVVRVGAWGPYGLFIYGNGISEENFKLNDS